MVAIRVVDDASDMLEIATKVVAGLFSNGASALSPVKHGYNRAVTSDFVFSAGALCRASQYGLDH